MPNSSSIEPVKGRANPWGKNLSRPDAEVPAERGCRRSPYAGQMTTAGQFIADLKEERRNGKISSETELHLKNEFRKIGWTAPDRTLATAIDAEIERLDREAGTLRRLRSDLFKVA